MIRRDNNNYDSKDQTRRRRHAGSNLTPDEGLPRCMIIDEQSMIDMKTLSLIDNRLRAILPARYSTSAASY
jgi:hypothetical protein